MVKINLIGKKRRESKNRSWIFVVAITAYVACLIYFFGSVVFVVYRLNVLNSQLAKVNQETQLVSSEMLANNQMLSRFVLSKFVLDKIKSLSDSRFKYKDYLDEVVKIMPVGVTIKSVDFAVKGWVVVNVSAENLEAIRLLENTTTDTALLNQGLFSAIFSENVSLEKTGEYNEKLQFEIRKNGGN